MEQIGKILASSQNISQVPKKFTVAEPVNSPRNRVTETIIQEAQTNLENNGYSFNPFCERCHGTGFLHPPGKGGRPDYSRVISCPASGCLAESYQRYKTGEKGLLSHGLTTYANSFANFRKRKGTEKALAVFKYLAEGDTKIPGILCLGITGCGKSHLCEALTIALLQRNIDTWYYTVAGLMSLLHRSIEDNSTDKLVEIMQQVNGLVLDDWGELSDWEEEKLKDIIDERYRWKRITVLTSNRSFEKLTERNERIVSRFLDREFAVYIVNEATDYRPNKEVVK
jgi:DNA replication protein DnaC